MRLRLDAFCALKALLYESELARSRSSNFYLHEQEVFSGKVWTSQEMPLYVYSAVTLPVSVDELD